MFNKKKYHNSERYLQVILDKLYKSQNGIKSPMDGFDDAYNHGIEVIAKELDNKNWDGGITENYLEGIEYAIRVYKDGLK